MSIRKKAWACSLLFALSGCASNRASFHELALYNEVPASQQADLGLKFDSFIVGVEKDNASHIGRIKECGTDQGDQTCLNINAKYFTERQDLRRDLQDKYLGQLRPTFVSHIARFDENGTPCFVYNIYSKSIPCQSHAVPMEAKGLLDSGWNAMTTLGDELGATMTRMMPSHVIVYTMGWNTKQPEALGNFRDLVSQLKEASKADSKFRPLVIGLTWPSTGDPFISDADFGIKAKDADEVGAVWENLLINKELRRLKSLHHFKLVVIGHSFGARVSSRAAFSGPLVSDQNGKVVDLLIGLQGAYSYQRFLPPVAGVEGNPYRDFADQVGLVALTASQHDSAVQAAKHAPYFVGSPIAYQNTMGSDASARFTHVVADENGGLGKIECDPGRVLYIESSAFIKGNQPGTGGGAHSVIYTPAVGHLVFNLVKACAT